MRERGLLAVLNDERGSAIVESLFGMFVLLFLVVGTIQIALTLYARNIVMASVHDGARAAIEIGGSEDEAQAIARRVIEQSAGSLVSDLEVGAVSHSDSERYWVRVIASGRLDVPGPIPIDIPITVDTATGREVLDVGR